MECKNCNEQLEEGVTLCPNCGQENQPEALIPEEAEGVLPTELGETLEAAESGEEEVPVKKRMTSGKLAVIYVCVIVLVAALLAPVILQISGGSFGTRNDTTAGTVPADGNKDDVTCQGSYTVSEKKVQSKADKVIATAGNAELTNEILQSIYWMQVYNFLGNYGANGLDTTQPLDRQICPLSQEGWTWQQYFLDVALQEWQMYNAFCQEAEAVSYESTVDVEALQEDMKSDLEMTAASEGFVDAEQMVRYDMGPGASLEAYLQFLGLMESGYDYYGHLYTTLAPTEDQIRAYYEENLSMFEESGVTDDGSVFVDVRHILLKPEEDTDAGWAKCEQDAKALLDLWVEDGADQDSFAALANEHSADGGSNTKGGLYEYVQTGDMLEEFDAWCFDGSRQSGDYGIVKTIHGYHLMYFVKSQPVWYVYAENSARNQLLQDTMTALMEKYPIVVDYSKIVLGESQYILTY